MDPLRFHLYTLIVTDLLKSILASLRNTNKSSLRTTGLVFVKLVIPNLDREHVTACDDDIDNTNGVHLARQCCDVSRLFIQLCEVMYPEKIYVILSFKKKVLTSFFSRDTACRNELLDI